MKTTLLKSDAPMLIVETSATGRTRRTPIYADALVPKFEKAAEKRLQAGKITGYHLDTADGLVPSVSISRGNTKMGPVPSVSLPPIITCPHGCPCAAKCYAAKLCRLRPTVANAYARNLYILETNPGAYWDGVRSAVALTNYFRFHVSGDIPNADYYDDMTRTAEREPMCRILAFTKRYEIVNHALDLTGGVKPDNLQDVFSAWNDEIEVPNPYNLPVAQVILKGQEPRPGWKICGGDCSACICRGIGCWVLLCGETIAFKEH